MNVPFTKQRVNESIFHESTKGYNISVNGMEAMKYGRTSLPHDETKKAPRPKPGRRMRTNMSRFDY